MSFDNIAWDQVLGVYGYVMGISFILGNVVFVGMFIWELFQ